MVIIGCLYRQLSDDKHPFVRDNSKIGPYGPELIRHFRTQLAKITQLSFPCIKTHALDDKESMIFKKILINFRKKDYNGIISCMYVGKEEILKYL